mgnify:FL=1
MLAHMEGTNRRRRRSSLAHLSPQDEDPATSLRLFNLVLLSELTNPIRPSLLHHAITIATATSLSLRSCLPSASRPELPLAEVGEVVNQAFANARLVVLLSTIGAGKDDLEEYWSIVWPSLLRLLTVSEMDGELSVRLLAVFRWTRSDYAYSIVHRCGGVGLLCRVDPLPPPRRFIPSDGERVCLEQLAEPSPSAWSPRSPRCKGMRRLN